MSADIHGFCAPRFDRLADAFRANFDRGLEVGASLAVTCEGETVVDLWGGYASAESQRPWERDTIVLVFSSTKIPTTLCALMLIDAGQLDIEAPVARYWPEFASNGKDRILVKHLFNHSAGLPAFSPPVPHALTYDWAQTIANLAAAAPWWEAGTQSGYHSVTYGFLIGEVIRRVSGQTPGVFLRERVASKAEIDFHIGIAPAEIRRMARTVSGPDPEAPAEPGSMLHRWQTQFLPPLWQGAACVTSENPGANGIGNARALARIGAIFAMNGAFAGHQFLSPATVDLALTEQSYLVDCFVDEPVRWGLGLGLNSKEFPCPGEGSLHWGGFGGSFMIADRDHRVSIAYAMNRLVPGFAPDPRATPLREAFIDIVRA